MALFDDILKGNVLTSLAVGLGAVLLAPMAGQVLRPAAKELIKGGILAYRGFAELGETASDMFAEAQAEVTAPRQHVIEDSPPTQPPARRKRENPSS